MPLASSAARKRVSGSGPHGDIRLNAAASQNGASGIGVKLLGLLFDLQVPARERLLDRSAAGSVVESCGERERGIAGQREYVLHQPFSIARLAQHHRAIVVLQCAGQNLGRAGRFAVHENSHGESVRIGGLRDLNRLLFDASPFNAEEFLSGLQEK